MERKLIHIVSGTIILLGCFLLTVNLWAQASDVTHIAFSSRRTGNSDIYIMDIEGKNIENFTNHPAWDFSPTFSPNGRWMAYVSDRDIYLMNLATKARHRLTEGRSPDWSPDGESIVFTSNRSGQANIYKIDVNGEEVQQLTNEGSNGDPSWSPDGESIIFNSNRDHGIFLSVYVMTADGRRQRRLADGSSPVWSPDGKQIAYILGIAGSGVYVMNAAGKNSRRLTPENTWSESPAWSPDGQWIAYETELENPWGNLNRDSNIYLISPIGDKSRRLTDHPAMDSFPAWVPAGFLSVSPTANIQTTLWGRLKKSGSDYSKTQK